MSAWEVKFFETFFLCLVVRLVNSMLRILRNLEALLLCLMAFNIATERAKTITLNPQEAFVSKS